MKSIRIRKVFVGGIPDDLEIVIRTEPESIGGGGRLSNIIRYQCWTDKLGNLFFANMTNVSF